MYNNVHNFTSVWDKKARNVVKKQYFFLPISQRLECSVTNVFFFTCSSKPQKQQIDFPNSVPQFLHINGMFHPSHVHFHGLETWESALSLPMSNSEPLWTITHCVALTSWWFRFKDCCSKNTTRYAGTCAMKTQQCTLYACGNELCPTSNDDITPSIGENVHSFNSLDFKAV